MYTEVTGPEAMRYLTTKPTMFITTLHETGVLNAGVFGAYTNLSATQVGVAVGTQGHTLPNIRRDGEFVINIPGADLVGQVEILAARIPPDQSEVEQAGLTARPGVVIKTPSIAECAAAVEFTFEQDVAVENHCFVIGRVAGGWIRDDCLDADGSIDIFKACVFHDFKYPQPLYVLPGEVVEG